ncbi:MAG: hypothetical protein DKINENOH_03188 [bacterium]|nr:hypothetical protein [bacterium]MCK6560602.1 class I SAM-dependent methyltransferase [bacterium]NUM66994.1 class I SAM-dependent methyltransferase [candidate division KSB1 bacterium]
MSRHNAILKVKQFNYAVKRKLWPNAPAPKAHYKSLAEAAAQPGWCVLHAGGGRNKHNLFQQQHVRRINVDLDAVTLAQDRTAGLRVLGNLEELPVPDNAFDLIVCEMVFEHLAHPGRVVREFFRSLKSGGSLIFITPNLLAYPFLISRATPFWFHRLYGFLRGRQAEDIFPTYYRLNTGAAIRRHFDRAGFELVQLRQLDASCDYFDILPGLHQMLAVVTNFLNRVEALSFLRQFHLGWFRKPAAG